MVSPKEFFEKVDFEKIQQTTKKREKLHSRQRIQNLLWQKHTSSIHNIRKWSPSVDSGGPACQAVEKHQYLNSKINIPHYVTVTKTRNLLIRHKLSMLGNFACLFVVCWFFSKSTFSKKNFRNIIRVSNSLDPDQNRHSVGPDLGPNCLQRQSADDTSRQRVISFPAVWQLLLSTDNLRKQFRPRSDPTKCWAWSVSKLFYTDGTPERMLSVTNFRSHLNG